MEDKEFHLEKNIKDLEYNKTLSLITTYAVILATFIISVALAEPLTPVIKVVIIFPVLIFFAKSILKLNRELETKLKEIKELKGK